MVRYRKVEKNTMIDICIPTHNRAHNLRKCLTALRKQTHKDFEVIISDDTSTDGTHNLINEFKDTIPKLKYIYSNNRPTWDCARPRNLALKLAVGELILILDSDILLTEKALEYYWEDYTKNPDRIILGRYDWLKDNFYDEKYLLETEINSIFINNPERILVPEYRVFPFETNTPDALFYSYPHALNCLGGNIGIPRKIFDTLGVFDEQMQMVEDGDFGLRSWEHQIAKSYDNRIRGWHLAHEIDPARNLKAGEQLKKLNMKHFGVENASMEWIISNRKQFLKVEEKNDQP